MLLMSRKGFHPVHAIFLLSLGQENIFCGLLETDALLGGKCMCSLEQTRKLQSIWDVWGPLQDERFGHRDHEEE